jgi:diacylglycerol O-acyltransferase
VLADGATVDDPHEVTDAFVDELVEIRRAAGLSEKLTVIAGALAPA